MIDLAIAQWGSIPIDHSHLSHQIQLPPSVGILLMTCIVSYESVMPYYLLDLLFE